MSVSRTFAALLVATLAAGSQGGCRKHTPLKDAPVAEIASATPPPIDRLAPGELAPGTDTVDGLVLPHGMRLAAHFSGIAHATGSVAAEDVANYVRDRVDVRRVELGVVGTVFPAVHVTGGDPTKVYRIEVRGTGEGTELVIRDVTPVPPAAVDPSIPVSERWRRAGYKPDGTPLDPMQLR